MTDILAYQIDLPDEYDPQSDDDEGSGAMMRLRDAYDDTTMFLRCYRDTLRSCLRSWGIVKGWYMASLWGRYGVEIQREYRDAERDGRLTLLDITH
jgi:hypothetical protein